MYYCDTKNNNNTIILIVLWIKEDFSVQCFQPDTSQKHELHICFKVATYKPGQLGAWQDEP